MAQIVRAASDSADGKGELSFALASEEPCERWYGTEILEVTPDAVDLTRAQGGLPLLVDHDTGDLVGVLENVRIDADKVIRGTPRWSRSARAQEIAQDVEDGIRTSCSIGYQVREWKEEKLDGGGMRYTAVQWTLLEGSLVAVPADVTVGVGRSAGEDAPAPEGSPRTPVPEVRMAPTAAPPAPGSEDVLKTERQRTAELELLVRKAPAPVKKFAEDHLREWMNSGTTVDDAKLAIFEEQARLHEAGAVPPAGPDLTEKDVRKFSIARAIQGLLNMKRGQERPTGFEFEISDEIAQKQERGSAPNGFFVPWQVQAAGLMAKRANELTVATQAAGGYLKYTEYAGFIELFRERLLSARFGMRTLPGLVGDFQWVRKTAGSTFSWGATELANATNSAWTLAPITLQPKIGQDALIVSRKMLLQSAEAFEPLMRDEINQSHAVGIEKAVLNGSGSGGQPTGIAGVSGIGDVAGGTNGLVPTYAHVLELWSDVATANADVGRLAYMVHPLEAARLAQVQRFTSTDSPLFRFGTEPGMGYINDLLAGYTTAVPSAQTKGSSTDCTYMYFGAWDQVVLGLWGALEVIVDQLTLGPSQVKLASIQMCDVGLLYPAAFSVMKDARP